MTAENLFKALSDPTRLRLLLLLATRGPLCVCELTAVLGDAQPKTSRHLGELRKAGLVADQKRGLWVFYSLAPALPDWAGGIITSTVEALQDRVPYAGDLERLQLVAKDADRCSVPASRLATP